MLTLLLIAIASIGGYFIGKRQQLESDADFIKSNLQQLVNDLKIAQLPDTPYCKGTIQTVDAVLALFGLERDKQELIC